MRSPPCFSNGKAPWTGQVAMGNWSSLGLKCIKIEVEFLKVNFTEVLPACACPKTSLCTPGTGASQCEDICPGMKSHGYTLLGFSRTDLPPKKESQWSLCCLPKIPSFYQVKSLSERQFHQRNDPIKLLELLKTQLTLLCGCRLHSAKW